MAAVRSPVVELIFFSADGWESWGLSGRPVISEGMPVLADDDLLLEDAGAPRPVSVVNVWLRGLPSSGCPAPSSWASYAGVLRAWLEFLAERGVGLFAARQRLKETLGAYAAWRAAGPPAVKFSAVTWNRHMSVLAAFYRWAVAEGHAPAEPFTYRQAPGWFTGQAHSRQVNLAVRRRSRPHVTIRYLESDYAELFLRALAGLCPDGSEDDRYRGRELARNAAVAHLALATGLRRQEFAYLLAAEIPALPSRPTTLPVAFPVPAGVTKGGKYRTTWVSYDALAEVHGYLSLARPLAADSPAWRPARDPLVVTEADSAGGRVNGERVRWPALGPAERARLVAPGGGSMLLALRGDGGPFTAWGTVFTRASARIRDRFEPRFPEVTPHRLRHTFALRTLERLVGGYYAQAARLVTDAGADAALALYLSKADPMMVLRDLLGHSSVLTTETYLQRLDMTRVYRDARERSFAPPGPQTAAAQREADAEFTGKAQT